MDITRLKEKVETNTLKNKTFYGLYYLMNHFEKILGPPAWLVYNRPSMEHAYIDIFYASDGTTIEEIRCSFVNDKKK